MALVWCKQAGDFFTYGSYHCIPSRYPTIFDVFYEWLDTRHGIEIEAYNVPYTQSFEDVQYEATR